MDDPETPRAFEIRVATGNSFDVWSNALTKTKTSSTPIPVEVSSQLVNNESNHDLVKPREGDLRPIYLKVRIVEVQSTMPSFSVVDH